MSLDEWHRVMRVNLDGVFLTLREAAKHMVERGDGGALVAVSSTSAIHGAPGMEHYAGSKAALDRDHARPRGRAGAVRHSLQHDPAGMDRDRHAATVGRQPEVRGQHRGAHRFGAGAPDDLGPAAVFLADPTATFHTGDMLVVDGGYTVF